MRHVRTPFLIVCGLALASPVLSQVEQALDAIRPEAIRAHMSFLADDLLEGRGTATRGYDIAARYVAARFEELGLEPAGAKGSWFQPVPLIQMTSVGEECSLTLIRDGRKTELKYGPDFLTRYVGQESSVTAPVVFAGFGVTAPELGYDDYAAGVQFAKLNFLISYLVAQDEKPPSWNPGDFFGDKFGAARVP